MLYGRNWNSLISSQRFIALYHHLSSYLELLYLVQSTLVFNHSFIVVYYGLSLIVVHDSHRIQR